MDSPLSRFILQTAEVCMVIRNQSHSMWALVLGKSVLSPLIFIIYMNWTNKYSHINECGTIGNCKISRMLFADLVLLYSIESAGLQRALNGFVSACDIAGMKISTTKTEVFQLSKTLISVR